MTKEEQLNLEILQLNKELLVENKRVLLGNEQMAIEEHTIKIDLYNLQKEKFLEDLREESFVEKVSKFHKLFSQPILDKPELPENKRRLLRVDLIQEELDELREAFINGDLVETADALADLQYVLSGTVIEVGMGEIFSSIFSEVHRSNMTKACSTEEEARRTVDYYSAYRNTVSYYKKEGKSYIVYRNGDNKVLKSVDYSSAKIKDLL